MMLIKKYLFIIFTFLTVGVSAQKIDSLKQRLSESTIADTFRVRLYNQLAKAYIYSDLDSAEMYIKEAFLIEEKLDYKRGLVQTWYYYALVDVLKNQPDDAIKKYKIALEISERLNNKPLTSMIANDLGVTLGLQGKFIESIEQFQKVLITSQEIKDTLGISYALTNIGSIHMELGNQNKAHEYLELSGMIGTKSKDPYGVSLGYSNLGLVAAYKGDTLGALKYERKALKAAQKAENRYVTFHSYRNIGNYALALKDLDMAEKNFEACYDIAKRVGDSTFLVNAFLSFSELYYAQKKYEKAISNAEKALNVSINIEKGGTYLADIRKQLAKSYAGIGDFTNAYKYLEEYRVLNDSITSKDNRQRIANMETAYKTSEKERENKLLKTQNNQILKQRQTIEAISLFLFIAVLIIFAFGYKNYRDRKVNIKLLEDKVEERTLSLKMANASLERFNYVASHDLKEPLRSIVSSAQLLERNLKVDAKNQQFMNFIKRDAKRLYELVNAMILVAKYKQIELKPAEIDLNQSILKVVKGLQETLEKRNASVEFEQLPRIKADEASIQLVFRQLIQNAVIFNQSKNPLIKISVAETATQWEIYFADNGIGMKEEFHEKIFEAFKRLHHYDTYSGTGIGLFLSKDLIEMQNGKIEVLPNTEKAGSTFKITLMKLK